VTGSPPFDGDNDKEILKRIIKMDYKLNSKNFYYFSSINVKSKLVIERSDKKASYACRKTNKFKSSLLTPLDDNKSK
jgi:hypothetical protein